MRKRVCGVGNSFMIMLADDGLSWLLYIPSCLDEKIVKIE